MKYLLPVLVSALLIGCGDSAPTQPEAQAPSETPAPADTAVPSTVPAAPEEASAPETAPAASAVPEPAAAPAAVAPKAAAAPSAGVDGSALFTQKCASCHGMKAEKPALGKSQVIAGWSVQQTKEALKGYQAGTYGKEMKALMQGQAKALDDAAIDALAKHISGL